MSADIEHWLQEGIAAAKAGRDAAARELLARVVEQDPGNEMAWLWLASVVETDEELRVCLERALEINPANDTARARLAMLDSVQTPAFAGASVPVTVEPITPAPLPPPTDAAPALDSEAGCPYCGQPVSADDRACPHCKGRLLFEEPRQSAASSRVWLLAFSWGLLAVVYLMTDVLIAVGLVNWLSSDAAARFSLFSAYLTGYVVNLSSGIPPDMYALLLRAFVTAQAIAVLWCLVIAFITPARRPGVTFVAGLIVTPFNLILALAEIAAGLYVSVIKLAATAAVGFFVFTSVSDFEWERVRYTLGLDRGLKTAMDFYNQGRRYRELGMLANAIVHWERAVLLAPEQTAYRLPLINALYRLGRYAEAAQHIRAALEQLPAASPQAQELREFLEHLQTR